MEGAFGDRTTLRTRELVAAGMTRSQIAWAVGAGRLERIRIGHFCLPGLDTPTERALRVGGRLACVSELERLGVWVTHPPDRPHVHLAANASRLRDADDMFRRLRADGAVLHWDALRAPPADARVAAVDACLQAMACLPALEAIATVESAVRLGVVSLEELLRHANGRERDLAARIDGSADSGLETLVREPLRQARLRVEPQYRILGIGDVDLVVEGWIAVELNGRAHHVPARDRRRDAAVAALGMTPLRFDYFQVVHQRRAVLRAIAGAVIAHRHVRRSGKLRAIRLLHAATVGIS